MIIKKKHVLLESLLIDKIDEFTKQEKNLLKVLHNKFGHGSGKLEKSWDFDKWKAAAFLIEDFEIPYDIAHSLASTYYWNGEKLFREYEPIRKQDNRSYLMMNYAFRDILEEYIRSRADEGDNYRISPIEYNVKTQNENELLPGIIYQSFEPRTYEELEESRKETNEVKFKVRPVVWSSYNGITLYIQSNVGDIIEPEHIIEASYNTLRNMGFMLHMKLEPYSDDDPKAKDFVKSEAKVTFGDEFKYTENVFNEDIKIPTPLSKDNIIKFIDMIIEKSRSAVNGMTFIYGKGEKR